MKLRGKSIHIEFTSEEIITALVSHYKLNGLVEYSDAIFNEEDQLEGIVVRLLKIEESELEDSK